jgi:hypothetical protein
MYTHVSYFNVNYFLKMKNFSLKIQINFIICTQPIINAFRKRNIKEFLGAPGYM